jgi:hypothetical protein
MSEDKRRQTHSSGEVYTHPRGSKYRDNFDRIFGKDEKSEGDSESSCNECEGCKCLPKKNEKSSDA